MSHSKKFYSILVGAAVMLSACGGEQQAVPVAPVPVAPVPGVPNPYPYPTTGGNCYSIFATSMTDFLAQMQACYGNVIISNQSGIEVYDLSGYEADVILPAGQYAWQDLYTRLLPIMSVSYDGAVGVTPSSARVDFSGRQGNLTYFRDVLFYLGFNGWGYYDNYSSFHGYGVYGSRWKPHYRNGKKGFNIGVGIGVSSGGTNVGLGFSGRF